MFFAGQLSGVEGYMESAASGIWAGLSLARELMGLEPICLPAESMLGSLMNYITDKSVKDFQPMGSNMGILPPYEGEKIRDKQQRYMVLAQRSLDLMDKIDFE